MERRNFLGLAVAGGGVAALSSACAPLVGGHSRTAGAQPNLGGGQLSDADGRMLVAHLDTSLRVVDHARPVSKAVADAGAQRSHGAQRSRLAAKDEFCRKALRAFVISDVASLAATHGGNAEVEAAIRAKTPIIEDAVLGHGAYLKQAPLRARHRIESHLRADPGALPRVVTDLDAEAVKLGISQTSRDKLDRIAQEVAFRARHQTLFSVADECVAKIEQGPPSDPRALATRRVLAEHAVAASLWSSTHGTSVNSSGRFVASTNPELQVEGRGQGTVNTGLWLGGVGLVVGAVSAGLSGAVGIGAAFGVTVGVVLLLVGLVVLIVGAVMNATE